MTSPISSSVSPLTTSVQTTAHYTQIAHQPQLSNQQPEPYLRRAMMSDLEPIMQIIEAARLVLAHDGIPQWQNGNPSREEIMQSIERGVVYVYVSEDGQIIGTASLVPAPDPNYDHPISGTWSRPTEGYAVIHRFAISPAFAGQHMGARMLNAFIDLAQSHGYDQVRIDTHERNGRMRHLIEKAGFRTVGEILVHGEEVDAERLTFEKLFQ